MPGEKIGLVGQYDLAKTAFLDILAGEQNPDKGTFTWGQTITVGYLPKDNGKFFDGCKLTLIDWLRQFSEDQTSVFLRGFLGRMLFSGEEAEKTVNVLSGGEKMRLMYSRLMLTRANVILLDGPTDHLDLESIEAVNKSLQEFKGVVLVNSHDHNLIQSVCNRIIEFTPSGVIDRKMTYDEYLDDTKLQDELELMY